MTGHVSRMGFGKDRDMFDSLVKYICDLKADGPLSDWEVPYFVRSFYEQFYEISEKCYYITRDGNKAVKHFNDFTKPLKMVSMTSKEGLMETELYRRRAWEYRTYKIKEVQGIDFIDWMNLPTYIMEAILGDIRKETAAINAMANNPPQGTQMVDGPVSPEQALRAGSKSLR